LGQEPGVQLNSDSEVVIGMAGQLYADVEWSALLNALDVLQWKLCGRQVRVRLLGRWAGIGASGRMNVEFLGWRPQDETVTLMSEADILFCPYWFDPAYETEARLSFPSKLTTYLAAGRPVLFFGPPYASPARFLESEGAGLCCTALDRNTLIRNLERLVSDTDLYAHLARQGREAFDRHFGLESLRQSFLDFTQHATNRPLQREGAAPR
jgi:glycosyltransferase involved in cell wall biosynthesis